VRCGYFTSPGTNPTTANFKASTVKNYNAMSSLVRFENNNIFVYNENGPGLLQRWRFKFKSRT
jgi:endo-alpha-1,4-polygalactosaminidase (GH114 family)